LYNLYNQKTKIQFDKLFPVIHFTVAIFIYKNI